MRTGASWIGALGLALGVAGLVAAPAAAAPEEQETTADAVDTGGSADSPSAAANSYPAATPDRYPKLDVPTKPWAYATSYYFALTRGLEAEGLTGVRRGFAMVGTVPMDILTLPGAALAGLFGT
jgi:hypothetical protein